MILLLLLFLIPDSEGELQYEVAEARVEVAQDSELVPPQPPTAKELT